MTRNRLQGWRHMVAGETQTPTIACTPGVVLAVLVLWGCGGPQTPEAQGPQQEAHRQGTQSGAPGADGARAGEPSKEELKALFERESEPGALQPVNGGGFRGQIESDKPPKVEHGDGYHQITAEPANVGTVQCFVYDDVIDAATSIYQLLKAASDTVAFKLVAPYPMAHDGLDPIVAVRGLYHFESEKGLVAGDYKVLVMARAVRPVTCIHDAPGYAKSFQRLASAFARSIQPTQDDNPPDMGELWLVHMNGVPVGYNLDKRFRGEGGQLVRMSMDATFIQVSPSEMQLKDTVHVVKTDKRDEVFESNHISVEGGQAGFEIELKRDKRGYAYAGTVQGKEVKGHFDTPKPLRDTIAVEHKLTQLAKQGKGERFSQWEYHPGIDPTTAIEVQYEVTKKGDGLAVAMTLEQLTVTLETDSAGRPKSVAIPVGPRTMVMELAERRGF